jgi:hypothetical protein
MKLAYRKTFFWTAVILFLVAAPILILNASGFRYDFQEKSLIQTGTLILKTQSAGARVWINREAQEERTPAEIERLLPQRYSVRIEADDFHPWQKEVEVRQAEITLKNILLIPTQIPLTPVFSTPVRIFALAPDSRHLAYARRGEDSESVWLLNLDENREAPLFRLEAGASEESPYSIDRLLWSAGGRHLAVSASSPGEDRKKYLLTEAEPGAFPFEIVLPGRENSDEWRWSEDEKSFFFMHQRSLYRADPTKRMIEQVVAEKITGYTTVGEALYFVTERPPALFKKDLRSQQEPVLLRPLKVSEAGGNKERGDQFIPSNDGRMAFLDRNGKLWLVDLNEGLKEGSQGDTISGPIASDVESASFSEDGRKMLYQTEKGLFVYYLKEARPEWGEKAGISEALVGQKNPTFGPVWYGDQAHVLYGMGETIFISETGEKPSIYPLVRTPGESPRFVYNKIKENLYLVYRDQLYQADLSFEKEAPALPATVHFTKPSPESRKNQLFGRIQGKTEEARSSAFSFLRGRS